MKLGMIVRADFGRGLAHQTKSFFDNLVPDVTVLVDNTLIDTKNKWPQNFDAFPGSIHTQWRGYATPFLNPDALDALAECDVVYSAETFYDERLPSLVNTVLHVNPEFYRNDTPTQLWYPTVWRTKDLPPGPIVPTPIDDDRIAKNVGESRILHVGGHRALGDRNGTNVVGGIIGAVQHPWRLTSQDGLRLNPRVFRYTEVMGRVEDHWELYEGCGILLYPRRYGGQSLQVNEAMARGLAVVMTDCEPNIETWPIIPIPSKPSGFVNTPGGKLQMHLMLPAPAKDTLDALIRDPEMLERWQTRSVMWARDNSWSRWKPEIERLLKEAASD